MRWQRDETVVLNREIKKEQDVIGNVHDVGPEETEAGRSSASMCTCRGVAGRVVLRPGLGWESELWVLW